MKMFGAFGKKKKKGKIEWFFLKLSFFWSFSLLCASLDLLLFSHHQSITLPSEAAHPLFFSSLQISNKVSNSKLL